MGQKQKTEKEKEREEKKVGNNNGQLHNIGAFKNGKGYSIFILADKHLIEGRVIRAET